MFGRRDMLKKRKTLKEWLQARTYMQVAMTLFFLSVVLLLICLWRTIVTAGTSGMGLAFAGMAALILAVCGIGVTLFGHFVVRMDGKWNWKVGIFTNGATAVILLLLYLSGLRG